ncbi:MAG: nicotinate-nucleotide adenylyltransferase [Rubricoccaceae bacterium]
MRLGVFGGSFNPPHVAHLAVAEAAAEAARLERVLWVPAATPPHKQRTAALAPARHRLAMTRLAVAGNPRFAVSDLEVARAGISYTVDTLRALAAAHPEATLALLLGGDSLAAFLSWREPEAIAHLAELVVYARPGSAAEPPPGLPAHARLVRVGAPALDVSSTALRARLAAGKTVRYLVPDAVRAYIAEHGLYGTAPRSAGPPRHHP